VVDGSNVAAGQITVQPDPAFPISDADRRTRETAVMSAYSLQQQLAAARDAYGKLSGQIAAARNNAAQSGSLDRLTAQASDLLEQISHCLTDTYNLETAMDGYQGVPTAAQLRDLDWLWADGIAAVASLNRLTEELGVSGVPVPVR
jgi:hypothetical protein